MIKIIKNAMDQTDFNGLLDFVAVFNQLQRLQEWKKFGKFWHMNPEDREKFFDESTDSPTYLSLHFCKDLTPLLMKSCAFSSRNNQDKFYDSRTDENSHRHSIFRPEGETGHFYYKNTKDLLLTFNPFVEIMWECKGESTPRSFEISFCHQKDNISFESYNVDLSDEHEQPWEAYNFGWLNTEEVPVTVKIEQEEITLEPNTLVISDKIIELATPSEDFVFSIKFYLTNGTDKLIDHNHEAFVIVEDFK